MDVERRLVSSIAATQYIEPLLACNLQPHHFLQRRDGDRDPAPTCGEVYSWMLQHHRRFRTVPSMDLLRSRFPQFEVAPTTDGVAALLEEMLRLVNRNALIRTIRHLSEVADDPSRQLDAAQFAFEAARDLQREIPSDNVTRFSDALSMLDLYKQRAETGTTSGVSTCMAWLDDLTYGVQSHEMMIIEGFLGTGKSSHAIRMCADAYFLRDQTPMFFSLEMEGHKLVQRWIAMCAKISYSAIKRLQLDDADIEKWETVGEKAAASRFEKDVIVIDDERRPTDDFIYNKIEQHRPSFVVVDTIDEVRAPNNIKSYWEKQDHVARELKAIARATQVPMVVIAQAGRDAEKDGATLGNIAGSITIARKADIALGIHATTEMKKTRMVEYTLLKNRDDGGEGTKKTMYSDPVNMELRLWVPNDSVPAK